MAPRGKSPTTTGAAEGGDSRGRRSTRAPVGGPEAAVPAGEDIEASALRALDGYDPLADMADAFPPPPRAGRRGAKGARRGRSRATDANDVVLRVLADLDFDPRAAGLGDGPLPSPVMFVDGRSPFISDILADLIEDEGEGDIGIPKLGVLEAFEERRLAVGIARGEAYILATEPVAGTAGPESGLARRMAQGRALLAYLVQVSGPGQGALDGVDGAVLDAARALGEDLAGRLPVGCDVDVPRLPEKLAGSPVFPGERFAVGRKDAPYVGLRRSWNEMHAKVAERAKAMEAARGAWALGTWLKGEVERLTDKKD